MKHATIVFLVLLTGAFGLTALGLVAPSHADEIKIAFDIKPGSCPNPINPPGFTLVTFPTAIPGTDSLDASSIDAGSLVLVVPEGGGRILAEITPIATHISDVATPFYPEEMCDCTDAAGDSTLDLSVLFDRDEVEAALGPRAPGEVIRLCITGRLLDGTTFEGCDCVFVVGPTGVESRTWGTVKGRLSR